MPTHFGVITPPVSGHIHPFGALARELIERGHRVTCFQVADLEDSIRAQGMEFVSIGAGDHPRGSLPKSLSELARLDGMDALRFTVRAVERTTEMVLRDAPEAISRAGVGALLVDQMEAAGGTIAEHLGIPFVTICNALPINVDPAVPPPFTDWSYEGPFANLRNRIGYAASNRMLSGISKVVAKYRSQWNLPRLRSQEDSFSKLAQISQLPREFDYPRPHAPKTFHYTGPLRRDSPVAIPFPWEKLDGRPLVYASLGTLQNRREPVFRCFAEACHALKSDGLDVQLVISHGGGLDAAQAGSLPGDPLVVSYAPQFDLLRRARLTITHAGLNTVLDSLANAVPLVAIPITYEQPAIARRVEWSGCGRSIPLKKLESGRLRELAREVLRQPRYLEQARRMAEAIRGAGGVRRAADVVESALQSVPP